MATISAELLPITYVSSAQNIPNSIPYVHTSVLHCRFPQQGTKRSRAGDYMQIVGRVDYLEAGRMTARIISFAPVDPVRPPTPKVRAYPGGGAAPFDGVSRSDHESPFAFCSLKSGLAHQSQLPI
ncbi:hypothetical protein [Phaffia rhodozyma]|uniref:Uncharacterized protein n=1 Tax=Phaffia rhodozyma TaxID=264483 RepID=A0A0F7SJ94_PHARH|nr:hypothetical protein [Phaffia rhodozyma]